MVAGVSDKVLPTPVDEGLSFAAPGGTTKWPLLCRIPPALVLLLIAGALMTDLAMDECWACFREAGVPVGVLGGEIRTGETTAVGVGGVQVIAPPRTGEYVAAVDRNEAGR